MQGLAFGSVPWKAARERGSQRKGILVNTNPFTGHRTHGRLDWRRPWVNSWGIIRLWLTFQKITLLGKGSKPPVTEKVR